MRFVLGSSLKNDVSPACEAKNTGIEKGVKPVSTVMDNPGFADFISIHPSADSHPLSV
jgi:hypothetical protein